MNVGGRIAEFVHRGGERLEIAFGGCFEVDRNMRVAQPSAAIVPGSSAKARGLSTKAKLTIAATPTSRNAANCVSSGWPEVVSVGERRRKL
jgi:hypothetical protein